MNWLQTLLPRALIVAFALLALTANAADLQRLVDNGHLSVSTFVRPDDAVVPGQKAQLIVEIATDSWFSGGTRITVPEVPGLVILQNEAFASNATEVRDGKTWVLQRWTLDVYPQRAGAFRIPALKMRLKVNAGSEGDIEGELFAPATPLRSVRPAALQTATSWVAAPEFTVEQRFDRALDSLQVGDAFERDITFNAKDTMAMMLPVATSEEIDGLAAYPAPPKLEDRNNRGETSAQRVQTISYVAEQPGEFVLPAQEYFWWNTADDSLEIVELPAQLISVGGALQAKEESTATPQSNKRLLAGVAALLVLVVVAVLLVKLLPRLPWQRLARGMHLAYDKLVELRRPALSDRLNP
ncbi:MAG: hypothetical protein Hals2KO_26620 [Halioglobus sp.]